MRARREELRQLRKDNNEEGEGEMSDSEYVVEYDKDIIHDSLMRKISKLIK